MATLELEGKLLKKLNVQSGTSAKGTWAKQEFVLEYQEGNYPASVCMSVWGEDKVNDLQKFNPGDKVKVSFNLSSREYNGKWYTDVRVWRMSLATEQPVAPAPSAPMPSLDDMPAFDASSNIGDDLPF